MTKAKPAAPAADPHARLQAAEAEVVKAAAGVAAAQKPHLEAALAALADAAPMEAELRDHHAQLAADPLAQQALANVWMITASARATLRARISAADQAIAAGEVQP
ncbi:MAG TPA: hypothetical protein VGR74_17330 [Actinomycetota bacterium]|jgi:hypothetical protein|nr:hypothetical protein [Actinomycetota bacterium]